MRSFALVLLCACGSVGNQQTDAAVTHDSPRLDVMFDGPSAPPCNVTAPFGTPFDVAGVNSNSTDDWGWLTPDQLTMYFTSAATSSSDTNIYSATRATVNDPFSGVALIGAPNTSTYTEERPVLSADGLALYFQSNNGGGNVHLYVATRANLMASFGTPVQVSGTVSSAIDVDPWLVGNGQEMYFSSTRSGVGNYDIYKAPRVDVMTYGPATAVGELNLSGTVDDAPVVSADGLEVFFASNRSSTSNGRNDVWHATRSSPTDGFGTPSKVLELSTDTTEDYVTWVSADRCTVLFTSDRTGNGSNGGYDIWMAKRPQ